MAALSAIAGVMLVAAGEPAHAQLIGRPEPAHLVLDFGYYDVLHNDNPAVSFGAEYRHDGALLGIFKPMAATFGTADGTFWIGAGIAADVYLGDHLVVTGSFAPGLYVQGDGKDIGYPLEFRSQIEIGYRFEDRTRLTVGFNHLSNSGLWADKNPGVEMATVNLYLPLDDLLE